MVPHSLHSDIRPVLAETVAILISERWRADFKSHTGDEQSSHETDILSFSVLLLATNWGAVFSQRVFSEIEQCLCSLRKSKLDFWYNALVWELALASRLRFPSRSKVVKTLIANFDHPRSSIRLLMLEYGWFVLRWLKNAQPRLLANFINGHVYSELAYVLATRLPERERVSIDLLLSHEVPECLKNQFIARLESTRAGVDEHASRHFWQLECECRRVIDGLALGTKRST